MSKTDLLDPEVLKDQDELSDEQHDAIKEKAYAQVHKEAKAREVPEDEDDDPFKKPVVREVKSAEAKEEEEKDDEPETPEAKKEREDAEAAEVKEAEDADVEKLAEEKATKLEAAKQKKEEELDEEEVALLKESDDAKEKAKAEERETYISEYSDKHSITAAQAEKQVDKIYGVRDKYKDDQKEMAQAIYHLNTKLAQAGDELSRIRLTPGPEEIVVQGKKLSKEETRAWVIEKYREKEPDLSEGLEDDKVFKMGWKEIGEVQKKNAYKIQEKMRTESEARRKDVLDELATEDKPFLKDIRIALDRVSDRDVLAEDFDIQDYVYWARGKNHHKDKKAAIEKAVAEALKSKKIVSTNPGGGGGKAPAKKPTIVLSDADKDRALDMYESAKVSDEKAFELYADFKKSTSKKTKK